MIDIDDRQAESLLVYAESVLAATVNNAAIPDPPDLPVLDQPLGAFSTLRADGELRGCIGVFASSRPLRQVLPQVVKDSALADHRFYQVQTHELSGIQQELSLLSPTRSVSNTDEITLGSHGVVLNVDGRRSVFLPEVATEQGWDLETTLSMLARKAGLATDAWRSATARFLVFNTVKIGHGKEGGRVEVRFL